MIELSRLNTFLVVERFKMETPEPIGASLISGEWVPLIDLSDAYLHIPFHQSSRKYLRQSLEWVINQEKFKLKSTPVFPFVGCEYYLDSALVKPTQERWLILQDLTLHLKVKTCFDWKMFDVANWVAHLNGENGPRGTPSHEALQFYLKEHWSYP